jgi:aspartate/methionine/tyrosine aminotransferase
VLYLVPDSYNPTGHLAIDGERADVATFASETTIVVDQMLRDLNLGLSKSMPDHMACHHRDIVTIGGLCKSMWAGLRIGWVRLPDDGQDGIRTLLELQFVPVIDQLVGANDSAFQGSAAFTYAYRSQLHPTRLTQRCKHLGETPTQPSDRGLGETPGLRTQEGRHQHVCEVNGDQGASLVLSLVAGYTACHEKLPDGQKR